MDLWDPLGPNWTIIDPKGRFPLQWVQRGR